jgi:pimeloyl-ACP methyl ester carboxylesterase
MRRIEGDGVQLAVLDALEGRARAHVVGRDFGAVAAWAFAAYVPDRVDRLVAMSVGHAATPRPDRQAPHPPGLTAL